MACGGVITTQRIVLGDQPQQLVGADDNRRRVTIFSAYYNPGAIYIMSGQNVPASDGFPIDPSAAYQFEDAGARVALWGAVGKGTPSKTIFVITEGA